MEAMKGNPLLTYLSVIQLQTRRRLVEDELELAAARTAGTPRPRRRRLLTAVRGAAAA